MDEYKLVIKALENHINSDIKTLENHINSDIKDINKLTYITGAFYMLSTILIYDNRVDVSQMIEIYDYFDSIFEKYYE